MTPSEFQTYRGYAFEDIAILKKYAQHKAQITGHYFVDGFGVKTLFACIPFQDPAKLNVERLALPLPDDGFHAEAAEYVALADAINRSVGQKRFCAVEIGAGWGPWIAAAGVLARSLQMEEIYLVGVEASNERFALMQRHLASNALRPNEAGEGEAKLGRVSTKLYKGAVWTHDGLVDFPETGVLDMGAAVLCHTQAIDYRDIAVSLKETPCQRLNTMLNDCGVIDFMHMDIQGAELTLIKDQIDWISQHVKALMVATHSRSIEGELIEFMFMHGWQLHREKPCRANWYQHQSQVLAKTFLDGSQYWINKTLD